MMSNKIPFFITFMTVVMLVSCKDKEATKETEEIKFPKIFDLGEYSLSLAEWSLHRAIESGKLNHLDFATKARQLGFSGVEYVSGFFADKAENTSYLDSMNQNAKAAGVQQLLIMVDGEGDLGVQDETLRNEAVQNHIKWIKAAKYLGCHSIRVNAFGEGSREDQASAMVDALQKLGEVGKKEGINIIVENHGGYSSDGKWLVGVIEQVSMRNVGTLPDFGNFCVEREGGQRWGTPCINEFDRYKGVKLLTPYAKAVSAKSYDFNADGIETTIDFAKMMDIIKEYEYTGFIGVEYEGDRLSEEDGILATKALLEKLLY